MGLDAVIRVEEAPPPDFDAALAEKFRQDWPVESTLPDHPDWPCYAKGEVHSLWRYYGEHYARGHWPTIRRAIEWLSGHTESVVFYSSDCEDGPGEPMTPEAIDRLQRFWDEHGNEPYDSSFR